MKMTSERKLLRKLAFKLLPLLRSRRCYALDEWMHSKKSTSKDRKMLATRAMMKAGGEEREAIKALIVLSGLIGSTGEECFGDLFVSFTRTEDVPKRMQHLQFENIEEDIERAWNELDAGNK